MHPGTHAHTRTHIRTNTEHAVKHIWETDKFSRVSLNPVAHPPFGAASRSKCIVGSAPRGTQRMSAYPGIFAESEPSCWISTPKTLRSRVIVLSSVLARLHVHASVGKVHFGELRELGAKRSSTRPWQKNFLSTNPPSPQALSLTLTTPTPTTAHTHTHTNTCTLPHTFSIPCSFSSFHFLYLDWSF